MTRAERASFDWDAFHEHCLKGLRLDQGKFDLSENLYDRSCLGTAFGSQQRALALVLVGLDSYAEDYFGNIRTHAKAAYEHGESYVFEDADGRNSFAMYMAMRIVATASWALRLPSRESELRTALGHLEDAIAPGRANVRRPVVDAEPAALFMTHSIQLREFSRALDFLHNTRVKRDKCMPWGEAIPIIGSMAESLSTGTGRPPLPAARFRKWFGKVARPSGPTVPYSTALTANDIMLIMELNAHFEASEHHPFDVIRALRKYCE